MNSGIVISQQAGWLMKRTAKATVEEWKKCSQKYKKNCQLLCYILFNE